MRNTARLPFLMINLLADTKSETMNSYPIALTPSAEELMEDFIEASIRSGSSERELYFLRESMHSLLRLKHSEELLEIRKSVNKLIPISLQPQHIRRSKSRRSATGFQHGQTQFVFGREI